MLIILASQDCKTLNFFCIFVYLFQIFNNKCTMLLKQKVTLT